MKNFASNEYWDTVNDRQIFKKAEPDNPLSIFLKEKLKPVDGLSALEIGCFPGTYLSVLGDLGYTLNGIDISPRTDTELKEWLVRQNYKVGQLKRGDVLTCADPDQKFDLVCSFGFTEHFDDYEQIIKKHIDLTKKDGKVVITTPNFKGKIQNSFHKHFDSTNLSIHNIHSMDPIKWKNIFERNSCKISYFGWFGNFDLWAETEQRSILKKMQLKTIFLIMKLLRKIPFKNSPSYSPFCGIIAEKL